MLTIVFAHASGVVVRNAMKSINRIAEEGEKKKALAAFSLLCIFIPAIFVLYT